MHDRVPAARARWKKASIRQAPPRCNRIEPCLAEDVGGECKRAEHRRKSLVADIEAARIRAERRHHQAPPITREAAPAHRASAAPHMRHGVQMPADLTFG